MYYALFYNIQPAFVAQVQSHVCWRMLTYADVCWRMHAASVVAQVQSHWRHSAQDTPFKAKKKITVKFKHNLYLYNTYIGGKCIK